jgi:nitrogen-specific signal transduction histidine kinase/CheY-like chemotaxis protein
MEVSGSLYRGPEGDDLRLSVTRDVTERVRVEEGLRQTQRLESLGVLAGGIAHDFNNLLTAMLGNATLALQELPESSPVREYLRDVEASATRAAELTGQMLAYAGKARRSPQPLDLSSLVASMSRLIEPSIFPGVAVVYDLPESLPPVEIDPAQAQQIVMNLLTNASEAIGEQAGTIRVAAGLVEASRDLLDSTLLGRDLPVGTYVWLAVTDTGCGMDEQTLAHVFDPFFTTKFAGRGLGLAALLGIARSHGGTLRVTSQLQRGTRFEIFFPATTALGDERVEPAHPPASWSMGGVVLVVDDDPLVRAVARRALEARGLEVVLATGGEEALTCVREDTGSIVAVVLDLTMPGLDGPATLAGIRRLRPGLPVILSSGYGSDVLASRAMGSAGTTILPKPYRAEDLWVSLERAVAG